MAKETKIDPEVAALARAIESLRKRVGVTQAQAAEAAEMTPQYWGMHEQGKVTGVHKPSVQRKIVEALNAAHEAKYGQPPNPPLTIADLDAELAEGGGDTPRLRLARIARELTTTPDPTLRQAVWNLSEGDVVISFPANLSPQGFKELESYFAVFLKANTRDN